MNLCMALLDFFIFVMDSSISINSCMMNNESVQANSSENQGFKGFLSGGNSTVMINSTLFSIGINILSMNNSILIITNCVFKGNIGTNNKISLDFIMMNKILMSNSLFQVIFNQFYKLLGLFSLGKHCK